ncbi:polyphenol oxidase family protein [Candidatus Haliotispira prima]|uniref:Polyphenol oxidase family protein n=1 Tax=Candidatus Haliotispira prima TaxID=3034016 RepID=A0ABY8MJ04_9SPIO|nr:polyphenol oxidase family protein [Candidatus Haliotispira prima]
MAVTREMEERSQHTRISWESLFGFRGGQTGKRTTCSVWPFVVDAHCPDTGFAAFSVATAPAEAVLQTFRERGIPFHLLHQVHGCDYVELDMRHSAVPVSTLDTTIGTELGAPREADAWLWLGDSPGGQVSSSGKTSTGEGPFAQAFGVYTADCIPALLSVRDPESGLFCGALMHLGRKGIESGLLRKCGEALSEHFSKHLGRSAGLKTELFLGPGIGPCCYEIPTAMAENFCRNAVVSLACSGRHPEAQKRVSHRMLDLGRSIREQALALPPVLGLLPENIRAEEFCTSCQAPKYWGTGPERDAPEKRDRERSEAGRERVCYSYRQGHRRERMYTVIVFRTETLSVR